ncbi:hypothetical protein D3C81_1780200 [compost metagenome]
MQPGVTRAGQQGCAQCRLFANEQRQHAEVGQLPRLRQQQPERLMARQARRLFQQPADRIAADHDVRIGQGTGRQLGQAQHAKRVQPYGAGHLLIVGQAGTAGQGVHAGLSQFHKNVSCEA